MKRYLFALSLCLLFIVGVSYAVASFITIQDSFQVVATATTTSQNKEIQTRLKKWGYYNGAIDGILGPKSISAIKAFQKKYGLVQDGIVGPKTAAKMGINLGSSTSSTNSSSDTYL